VCSIGCRIYLEFYSSSMTEQAEHVIMALAQLENPDMLLAAKRRHSHNVESINRKSLLYILRLALARRLQICYIKSMCSTNMCV
jgi:hypothetical protein